jgi:hypothetical protein
MGGAQMPTDPWLAREYVKGWLTVMGRFKRRIPLEEFKLLFAISLEDEKLLEIAKELGFKVSKKHRCIVVELKKRREVSEDG